MAVQGSERKQTSGFRNARIRELHWLPLDWRHLTDVDLTRLKEEILRRSHRRANLETLEACLLTWASLTTGRHAADLLSLPVVMKTRSGRLAGMAPGLIVCERRWSWWLPSMASSAQQAKRAGSGSMLPIVANLYLPATSIVASLVTQCLLLRRRRSAGRDNLSGVPIPLFSCGEPLLAQVRDILAGRHPTAADRARRATTSIEAVARWLPSELVGAAGGDVVPVSLLTGRTPRSGRTAIYYGAVRHDRLVGSYRTAIRSVDDLTHHEPPPEIEVAYLGDALTPGDAAVRLLIASLLAGLDGSGGDWARRHRAMTSYTVALLAFALAHRGQAGSVPSLRTVDDETRFCWIRDKDISGVRLTRLVWICDIALRQLQLFETHLDRLEAALPCPVAEAVVDLRRGGDLPLFDLAKGGVQRLTVVDAMRTAMAAAGLPKNAGRHWLRARLVSRCSTESLQALFGHGPIGDGSWDATSTLDPAVYRADLSRVLDPALAGIGWVPAEPTVPSHKTALAAA